MQSLTGYEQWTDYHRKSKDAYHSYFASAVEHYNYHSSVFYRIKKLLPPPACILDVGTGRGYGALCLHANGYRVTGVDIHEETLKDAAANAERMGFDISFERGDAVDLGKYHGGFDLAMSFGLVEHFETSQTVELLGEQARCARYVLAVIPTPHSLINCPAMGERYYTPGGFRGLYKKAGLEVVATWGYGDVPLTWARVLRFGLPPLLHRFLAAHLSITMNLACIGENPARAG